MMKMIRDFFCNIEPFFLTIGGLSILFFGGMGVRALYAGTFLEYLSVLGLGLGVSLLFLAVFVGSMAAITWAQSHCEKS